jgi:hypothetical protein
LTSTPSATMSRTPSDRRASTARRSHVHPAVMAETLEQRRLGRKPRPRLGAAAGDAREREGF